MQLKKSHIYIDDICHEKKPCDVDLTKVLPIRQKDRLPPERDLVETMEMSILQTNIHLLKSVAI